MKKLILFSITFTTLFTSSIAQVSIQWATRYSSSGSYIDKAEDMVMDAAGNTYVTGIGRGASGGFDYITIKYNSVGAQQWKAEYNGVGNGLDEAHAIAVDVSGNVYVTGWSNGGATPGFDYATVKYNSSGVQQWATSYNNTTNGTDEAWDIGVDNAGNVYVTGSSDGTSGNSAATTIKYNSAGAQQFVKRYDGVGNGIDGGFALYVEPVSGTFYITGYSFTSTAADFDFITIKYTTAGTQSWATLYNGPDANYDEARAIAVDALGNVYVTGYSQTLVSTNYNYSTVKYNSLGVAQWSKSYNGTADDYDRANAIKLDAAKNIYVTGRSVGTGSAEDIVTIKYNNSGVSKWTARYNGTSNGYDEGNAIDIDASGNIYVAGYTYSATSNNDYVVIKYDSTGVGSAGTQQWVARYNGTGNNNDQAVGVGVDAGGNIYVSGQSRGSGTNDDYATVKFCQLTANAGTDTAICKGASAQLKASATGAVSYAWTPATGLSSTTIFNPVATPTITTTYIVSITNGTGCVDEDTVVVTVVSLPVPTITASGPTAFCTGDSVILTASVEAFYQWNTGATSQSIKATTSGTYTVTVTNPTGCKGTASKVVTVNSIPVISAGANDSICLGTTKNLLATGGSTYVWHFANTLNDSLIANPVATPSVTTTYTVIGTSSAGCSSSAKVTIKVLSLPAIDAGLNNNVCLGSSVNIQATGGFSYVWHPGNTLSDSTIYNPDAKPLVTTTYTVVGTAANGCKKSDVVKITVLALPAVNAGLDDSICPGASINLQASGAIFYAWHPGTSLDDSTIFDPIASPGITTTYTVIGTGISGCTKMDEVIITVLPVPAINAGVDKNVCKGSSIQLQATGGNSYVWSPASTLSNSTIFNPLASPVNTTTYTVIGTDAAGCTKVDAVKITVLALPIINAGVDDSVCPGSSVQLQASGGISYVWSPAATLSSTTVSNPFANPSSTTTYTVVGTDAAGCTNNDKVKIFLLPAPSVPTITRSNDTLYCGQTATSYKWYFNGILIAGATNKWYNFTQTGNYYVEVYSIYGCSTASSIFVVVGVDEIEKSGLLSIYPNPVSDQFTLEFNFVKAADVKINLYNIAGQIVFTDDLGHYTGTYKKQINLQGNAKGVYYLQVITNDRVINAKVVKQ